MSTANELARNLIAVTLSPERLFDLVQQECWMIRTDNRGRDLPATSIPEDARPTRMYYDHERDVIVLVLAHPTFPKCYEGSPVTYVKIEIRDFELSDEGAS